MASDAHSTKETPATVIKEKSVITTNGIATAIVLPLLFIGSIIMIPAGFVHNLPVVGIAGIVLTVSIFISFFGFYMVHPNEAVALTLFGDYRGSDRNEGLRWANPFFSKSKISLRVRNFDSDRLKVNDLSGSPIEIATVVVWRVVDSAEALFSVDDYQSFVRIQAEAALRNMATRYPYDGSEKEVTLRGNADEVAVRLKSEIQDRLEKAGVEVTEARISHLAYAPEIASAMLQRQQAGAIIAARQRIVEGAVGMVQMAIDKLKSEDVIDLDEERKAAMVSNLLVVLCGDKATQPVVNTGSLYT